jgi:hypothetical protein
MASYKFLGALVIILSLPSSSWAKQTPKNKKGARAAHTSGLKTFNRAERLGESEPFDFVFTLSGYRYRITSKGQGARSSRKSSSQPFTLKLYEGAHLVSVSYSEYEGDVLLICEDSDEESGGGFATRLDRRTLQAKWTAEIPGFNIEPGLIEGRFVYFTAFGFVAKLDLRSGSYIWQHDGLYREPDTFNAFERPQIVGDAVLFKDRDFFTGKTTTLTVDKRSSRVTPSTPKPKRRIIDRVYVSADGNIHIVSRQGREIMATKTGDCADAKIADDGRTVGWLVTSRLDPEHPDLGHPDHLIEVAEKLVIYRNGRLIRTIIPGGFIREWRFRNKGRQVVIYTGGLRFAGVYFLYDIATGREFGFCNHTGEKCPGWTNDL